MCHITATYRHINSPLDLSLSPSCYKIHFFFYNTLNLHIEHLWKCLTLPSNPRLHPPHPKTISPLYANHPPPSNMRRHRELSTLRPARNAFAVPNPGSKHASGLCNCCLEKSSTRHSNIWVDTFAVQAILVRSSVGFFSCVFMLYILTVSSFGGAGESWRALGRYCCMYWSCSDIICSTFYWVFPIPQT